jgi:putative tricarboxylic transport membrane protein
MLNLAQGLFGSLEAEDVRWVASLATEPGVIGVRSDSEFETLGQLVAQWRADPGSIVAAGGSAMASQDHVKVLLVADAAGVDPLRVRYVPFDGGGEAQAAVVGGFVDLFSGELSEVLPQVEAGAIRVLAVLSAERLAPPWDHLPTTVESGIDVEWPTWRGYYLPGEVTDSVYDLWTRRFEELGESSEWEAVMRTYGWQPFLQIGPEFEQFVFSQVRTFEDLARRMGLLE